MNLDALKKIDLAGFLSRHYGVTVGGNGAARCPFHDDHEPSLSVSQKNGVGLFKCHGCGAAGSILDFVMKKGNLSLQEAARHIEEIEGIREVPRPESETKIKSEVVREHIYLDSEGHPVFKKTKLRAGSKVDWCLFHSDAGAWRLGKNGKDFIPYNLNRFNEHDRVIICEGEKDADTVNALGLDLFATSAPTGCSSWPDSITGYFSKFKEAIFLYDIGNDSHVEKHAAKLRAKFPDLTIKIATVPGTEREFDISDYLGDMDGKTDAMIEILSRARPFAVKPKPEQPRPKSPDPVFRPSLAERGAELVKIRAVPWLWRGVMPTHMVTAITGDAGQGKSLVAVDLAARVSRGVAFPVYDKPAPPVRGRVFYITSEGVPEMILVPRLMAAGADLSKITIIEGVYLRKDHFSMFDITRNLPDIERRARDFPDLKLIIVDPIASFLPERINTNQGNAVRQAMDRISDLAFKLGIASPVVMHFAKTPGAKAIHRTSGSVQFEASVKMSWSVIRRESDPHNVRLLVPQKSNITNGHKSLSFSIYGVEFPTPDDPAEIIETAKIVYGDYVDEDPETLISPPIENDNHVASARQFLVRKLAAGTTLYAKPLIDEAEEQGIPKWALYKAKDRMGILHDKEGTFQGRTFWFRPREKS